METILFLWGMISAFLIFSQRSKLNQLTKDFESFKVEAGAAYRRLRDAKTDLNTAPPAQTAAAAVKPNTAPDAVPPKPVVVTPPPAPAPVAQPPVVAALKPPVPVATPQYQIPSIPKPAYAAAQPAQPSLNKQADPSLSAAQPLPLAAKAEPAKAPPIIVPPAKVKPAYSIDRFMSGNWLVWIGGLALALGGGFLVKVSYDAGFFGPAVRIVSAGILAALLVVAAEFLRRRPMAKAFGPVGPDSAPAILAGAGLFIGYADVFAAYSIYNFFGAPVAFALLSAIAFLALGLSPRHGKPIGLLGLLGAFIVPLLVSSKTPQMIPLYIFLAAVAGASVGVFRSQRWWNLTGVALAGSLTWGFVGSQLSINKFNSAHDALIASGLYLIFITVVFCLRWQPNRKALTDVTPNKLGIPSAWRYGPRDIVDTISLCAAIGSALIMFMLVLQAQYQPVTLWLGGTLLGLLMLRAATRPGLDILSSLAMALFLGALYFWAIGHPVGLTAQTKVWTLILLLGAGGGAITMMLLAPSRPVPAQWALGATASLGAAYVMSFGYIGEAQQTPLWAGIGAAVAALPFMALAQLRQTGRHVLAQNVYAAGVFGLLGFALIILFERNNLTLALALFVTLIAIVHGYLRLTVLQWIAGGIALLVLGRLGFNSSLITQSVQPPIWNWLLPIYGGAAVAFIAAHRLFRISGGTAMLLNLLEAAGIGLTVMLVSMNIRSFVATDSSLTGNYGFVEQAMQSIAWLGFSLGLGAVRRQNVSIIIVAARWGLFAAAMINIVLFQVLISSPLVTGLNIGTLPVLNLLSLGILIPGILLMVMMLFAERRKDTLYGKSAGIFGLSLIIFWSMLEMRHWFQGAQITLFAETSLFESFCYPLLFLLWGIGLYVAKPVQARPLLKWLGLGMFAFAGVWICFGNLLSFSPLLRALKIGSLPVLNTLAAGYALPGLLCLFTMVLAEKRDDKIIAKFASIAGTGLLIFWSILEMRHWYQGQLINLSQPLIAAEAYSYPVLFLFWSLALRYFKQANARPEMRIIGYAMLMASGAWVLLGNVLVFSPLLQKWSVGPWPVANLLALAYLVPSAGLAARLVFGDAQLPKNIRAAAITSIGLLVFLWCNLTLRHAFQGPVLTLGRPYAATEYYGYSLLWLAIATGIFGAAMRWHHKGLEYAFMGLTLMTILKVFLFDMNELSGVLRAVSFIGLGLSLMGLGLLYRRFIYRRSQLENTPTPENDSENPAAQT